MTAVGIVGCGTIGSALAKALERNYADVARVVALADQVQARARALQQQLASHPPIVSLPVLIRRSRLVIEAASAAVAPRVAHLALAANRDVLIMSTGGLLARSAGWQRQAQRSRGRLYIPSGGLCGLDGLKAMAVGTIRRIALTTRKPPQALASAPFVQAKRLHLERLRQPVCLFQGSPAEAIKAFPQNTNVAATMALAALIPSRRATPPTRRNGRPRPMRRITTTVRVIADPTIHLNVHELDVEGDCGRLQCRVESRPSETNPKTSELAIRSALATVQQLFEPIRIGT